MSFNPMFSTTSAIKFEFSNSIVTSNVLTMTNENHERCIFAIFRVNVPRSECSMHFHGFIFFQNMLLVCLFSRMRYNTWDHYYVVSNICSSKLLYIWLPVIIIDLLRVKNNIKNMISGCSLRIHLIKTMTFFSWENFFLERFFPNIFLRKSFFSLYPFVLLINAV